MQCWVFYLADFSRLSDLKQEKKQDQKNTEIISFHFLSFVSEYFSCFSDSQCRFFHIVTFNWFWELDTTFKYSIHFLLYLEWKEVIKNGKNKKFYGLRLEAEVRHEIKATPDTGESGLGQVWRLESDQLNTSRDEKMKVNLTSNLVLSIMLFKTEFNGISST